MTSDRGGTRTTSSEWLNPLDFDESGRPYKSPAPEPDHVPIFVSEGSALFFPETTPEPARASAQHGRQSSLAAASPRPERPLMIQDFARQGPLHENTLPPGARPIQGGPFRNYTLATPSTFDPNTSPYAPTTSQPRQETREEVRARIRKDLDQRCTRKRRKISSTAKQSAHQPTQRPATASMAGVQQAQLPGQETTATPRTQASRLVSSTDRVDPAIQRESKDVPSTTANTLQPSTDEPTQANLPSQPSIARLHSHIQKREQKLKDHLTSSGVDVYQATRTSRPLAYDSQNDVEIFGGALDRLEEQDAGNFLTTLELWEKNINERALLHKLTVYKSLREMLEEKMAC